MMLALRLGRSLRELLMTVDSSELTLWQAFDEIEPLGDWRLDLGFGVVASTVANMAGKSRVAGAEALVPRDFMPLARRHAEDRAEQAQTLSSSIKNFFANLSKRKRKE